MVFVLLWLVYHDGSKSQVFPRNLQKKKRALAVLTEKAMINKTKEGMSLHDEYIKLAETCQELQGE